MLFSLFLLSLKSNAKLNIIQASKASSVLNQDISDPLDYHTQMVRVFLVSGFIIAFDIALVLLYYFCKPKPKVISFDYILDSHQSISESMVPDSTPY